MSAQFLFSSNLSFYNLITSGIHLTNFGLADALKKYHNLEFTFLPLVKVDGWVGCANDTSAVPQSLFQLDFIDFICSQFFVFLKLWIILIFCYKNSGTKAALENNSSHYNGTGDQKIEYGNARLKRSSKKLLFSTVYPTNCSSTLHDSNGAVTLRWMAFHSQPFFLDFPVLYLK